MFEVPTFEIWAVVFTGLGAIVVWGRLGPKKIRVFALSRLIEALGFTDRRLMFAEFFVFVGLGIVVGVAVVQPTTVPQALAAGMGWTGLLSQPSSR